MNQPTEEQFLKDVAGHRLTVLHHDGLYRHLQFNAARNSWNMWFHLVTWPGVLTITGDMGTWVFSRVEDMFTFFRSEKLAINPDYWAEKLRHGNFGGRDGAKVWDEDNFKERLLDQLTDHYSFEGAELEEITEAVKEDIFRQECKYDMLIAARDFSHQFSTDRRKFQFDSCDMPSGMVYSYHFIWCCYAIVWGIQQWDNRPTT
jgi:hypothetical protein